MIKLEKRVMPYCENCDMFAPSYCNSKRIEDKLGYETKVIVECIHDNVCRKAINQYNDYNTVCAKITIDDVRPSNRNYTPYGAIE